MKFSLITSSKLPMAAKLWACPFRDIETMLAISLLKSSRNSRQNASPLTKLSLLLLEFKHMKNSWI